MERSLDVVRRAAEVKGHQFDEVAVRTGMRPAELGRLVGAWLIGGADAVSVLDNGWTPDPDAMEEGRAACAALGTVRVQGNRLTVSRSGIQLRLGQSGSWYRFERARRSWALTGGPAADPADLLPHEASGGITEPPS
jgi:hypothetical protein